VKEVGMDYEEYLRSFNSIEDKATLLEHYAPDVRIEGANGLTSLDDFLDQLRNVREGVRVTAVPITVLGDEHRIMAELDITYAAERDRPDHPIAPLKAGESVTMRFFSSYDLEDGRIVRFSRAFWRV
jgi:ketosteroid isomerase-like protein